MYEVLDTAYGVVIVRTNEDGTFTSFGEVESNSDYQAYLAWLEDQA